MPQAGDILGSYTLLRQLAVGGMGEIFLAARRGPLGFASPVALKVLRTELSADRAFVEMLVDEANISMFLSHQNVVSVLDFAESQGNYYIAMEYVQGVTLKDVLEVLKQREQRFSIPMALYVAGELCRALKYAHTRHNHAGEPLHIVHRDVTPGNVLVSIHGEVKLTDFGIARARGRISSTEAGIIKGKFGYMAPEMVRYEHFDARADLFCAGVVIYEMLAGKHPVEGSAIMEAIQRFEAKRLSPPSVHNPEVPKALDQIMMRALEPQPADRWPSAAALASALQDFGLSEPAIRSRIRGGAEQLSALVHELFPEALQPAIPPEALEQHPDASRAESDPAPLGLIPLGDTSSSELSRFAARPAIGRTTSSTDTGAAEFATSLGMPALDGFDDSTDLPESSRTVAVAPALDENGDLLWHSGALSPTSLGEDDSRTLALAATDPARNGSVEIEFSEDVRAREAVGEPLAANPESTLGITRSTFGTVHEDQTLATAAMPPASDDQSFRTDDVTAVPGAYDPWKDLDGSLDAGGPLYSPEIADRTIVDREARGVSDEDPNPRKLLSEPNSPPRLDTPIGHETSRWMAGEIGAEALSWGDDEAGRRAVATRHSKAPVPQSSATQVRRTAIQPPAMPSPPLEATGRPLFVPPLRASGSQVEIVSPPPRLTVAGPVPGPKPKRWSALLSVSLVLIALSLVIAVLGLSKALWPTVSLSSQPSGARVIMDGRVLSADTPLKVRVKPYVEHLVEVSKEGYVARPLDPIHVGYGESMAYTVALEHLRRRVSVTPRPGRVYLGERLIGSGVAVDLPDLDPERSVTIRVEADGMKSWSSSFEHGRSVPASIDAVLSPGS